MVELTRPAPSEDLRLGLAESQWHDMLRLFLLLQVVFGHMGAVALPSAHQLATDVAQHWPSITFRLIWRFGPQAAFLFVFLSGFMVAGPLLTSTREGKAPSARAYFSKRLHRIVPISVCAVLLTALLDIVSRFSPGACVFYYNGYAYDMVAAFNWTNFIGNLLFLQPVLVDSFGSNGPLWTLGYIVQYYILGWILSKIYVSSRLLALIMLVLCLGLMANARAEWAVLFLSWLSGGVARHTHVSKRLFVPFLLLGCLLFVVSNIMDALASAASSIAIGFLLTMALRHLPAVRRLDMGGGLRRLSNESYAIYAVHHPVLMSIYAVVFLGAAGPNLRFFLYVAVSLVLTMVATITLNGLVGLMTIKKSGLIGSRMGHPK